MDKEKKEKAKALFFEALNLASDQREAFLKKECEDDADLLHEIQSLLDSHFEAEDFMEQSPLPLGANGILKGEDPKKNILPPEKIGPYKILKVLGEGGMGVVYLAEQTSPVKRQVALKVIKLGMDTKEVVARFDLEKQAMAMMNHTSIAKAFDAGATEQGQPYFVMEYVDGSPISKYCDDNRLTFKQRLLLFVQVCNGIQHAHQKGIIHRDLKPSNVLVTQEGDRAIPKIIDFGVARATDQRFSNQTAYTKVGAIIGTPEYMSPEQAELTGMDIDTRTDIYTLGILLYELLVGKLPFDFSRDSTKRYSDIQNRIQEEIPKKPSQRISTFGSERYEFARKRSMEFRSFKRLLKGDLDWIVMKAMEKDRMRRYASASELAADILRHLDKEPVLAGPPSALYRLRKFVGKNKTAVFGTLALILVLSAGLTVSTFFYVESENAKAVFHNLLVEYRKLADLSILESLKEEAKDLWPERIERVPAMKAWLLKAEDLTSRLTLHEETLNQMRQNALPYDEENRSKDQTFHFLAEDLWALRKINQAMDKRIKDNLPPPRSTGGDTDKKDKIVNVMEYSKDLKIRIRALEKKIKSSRLTWRFSDSEDQLIHDNLTDLVKKLNEFNSKEGLVQQVIKRIENVEKLKKLSIRDYQERWDKAIHSIGDPNGVYNGLKIVPQIGLIPLGQDPFSGFWEFSHIETGEIAEPDREGVFRVKDKTGLVFVFLPGGKCYLGANTVNENSINYYSKAYPREEPVHEVILDPFFLSKYEMTRGQYFKISGETPSYRLPGDAQNFALPVEQVSWYDCYNELHQHGLTLPTEAQWEYAYRAGTHSIWHTGDDEKSIGGYANLSDITAFQIGMPEGRPYLEWLNDGYDRSAPVGCFKPNDFGLYDMMGNVFEWCKDYYDAYEMPTRPGTGEMISDPATHKNRISRGGAYLTASFGARSTFRVDNIPNTISRELGVRPARLLDISDK